MYPLYDIDVKKLSSEKNMINVSIQIDKKKSDDFTRYLKDFLNAYNDMFNYIYLLHNDNIDKMDNVMKQKINNMLEHHFEISENQKENYYKDILELKRQVDNCFFKIFPETLPQTTNENSDELDKELMDKIAPLVPEGKEILLKNVVKEINGSAKGLSDFVILFTKYRQSILNYNSIEYFQRKGCHFLRKI